MVGLGYTAAFLLAGATLTVSTLGFLAPKTSFGVRRNVSNGAGQFKEQGTYRRHAQTCRPDSRISMRLGVSLSRDQSGTNLTFNCSRTVLRHFRREFLPPMVQKHLMRSHVSPRDHTTAVGMQTHVKRSRDVSKAAARYKGARLPHRVNSSDGIQSYVIAHSCCAQYTRLHGPTLVLRSDFNC